MRLREGKMTDRRPTDRQMITRALTLLRAGVLSSNLPNRLMEDFSLTPDKAREMAGKALERHKVKT